jgi:CelD/BcsL family acetyltransferase involved in cellulose biosynthesis
MKASIDDGCAVFDYTVGDDAYKKDWTDIVLPLYALTAPLSLKAHLHQRGLASKRKLRESLKKVSWLRSAVVRLRDRLRRKKLIQAQETARAVTAKMDRTT